MKTPSELSLEGREEFNKFWGKESIYTEQRYLTPDTVGIVLDFILSQEVKILESVEEWAEGKIADKEISNGYYNAMSDLITFLKEQSEIIKRI